MVTKSKIRYYLFEEFRPKKAALLKAVSERRKAKVRPVHTMGGAISSETGIDLSFGRRSSKVRRYDTQLTKRREALNNEIEQNGRMFHVEGGTPCEARDKAQLFHYRYCSSVKGLPDEVKAKCKQAAALVFSPKTQKACTLSHK